jgi:DNA polymerase I-like protein with 3'-5' exonuclease and polymerase domains
MRHGIKVDVKEQKKAAKLLRVELKGLHAQLNEMAGEELFATETRSELRDLTTTEWNTLLNGKWREEKDYDKETFEGVPVPPPSKYIDRDARNTMKENGLVYMMSGKNAGQIRYKVITIKKDFSKDKLLEFFYDTLNLPKQHKLRKVKGGGRKKGVSLDEDAIRKLMYKHTRAIEPGGLLLQYRGKKKELDYLKGAWDSDGRIRCTYKLLTNAGRLASAKNPMRKGYNLQNLKR